MRHIADSMIIGFIALRVLNGATTGKMTESVVIALFALSVLTACSTQSVKSVETDGCGDKKGESGASSPPVGLAPSSPPEKTGTDDTVQPSGGAEQSPSGTIKEQNREGERKSERR